MKFRIVAVGHKMPAWINIGFNEYAQRMPREARVELIEVKPAARAGSGEKSTQQWLAVEAERIRAALPARACKVVLDERGTALATADLARRIERWRRTVSMSHSSSAAPTARRARCKEEAALLLVAVAADAAARTLPRHARRATLPRGVAAGGASVSSRVRSEE